MKVITPEDLALLYAATPHADAQSGDCRLVLACLACFPFASHVEALLPEKTLWDCAMEQLPPGVPLDEGQVKPRGEFLVYGNCHATPDRGVTRARDVQISVGPLSKKLTVFGDRYWHGSRHGDPDPFSSMPLTWDKAFGGGDNSANPLGKGQDPLPDGRRPMPNVEHHDEYMSFPQDRPKPAGLGALAVSWEPRSRHAGTLDRSWFEGRWPGVPADCGPEFFMCAPEDQRLPGFFSGDEGFQIFGMHPVTDWQRGVLPAVRCRVFVLRCAGEKREFEELEARADTLTLFPEKGLGALTFRAVTHTADEECGDLLALLAVFEPSALPPQPAQEYRQAMEQALTPPVVSEEQVAEPETEPEAVQEELKGKEQQVSAEIPGLAELEQVVAEVEAQSRTLLDKARVTPQEVEEFLAKVERQTRDLFPPEKVEAATGKADPASELRSLVQDLEDRGRELLRRTGKSEEEVEALLKQHADLQEPPDLARHFAPRLEDQKVSEELKGHMRTMIDSFGEVAAVCASLEQLAAGLKAPPEPADEAPLEEEEIPEAEPQALTREELLARYEEGRSLAGAELCGLDLAGLQLPGIDLRGALLRHTRLVGSNLAGARLQGADLRGGLLDNCILEDADLSGALLEKCSLKGGKAKGVKARQAGFQEAQASGADFSGACMEDADFSRAVLDCALFTKASAPRLRLLGASLKRADFTEAGLQNSRGDARTNAEKADFSGADMSLSGWRGACLQQAVMVETRLEDADLGHCNLKQACMTRAHAGNAVLFKANLQGARLCQAVLDGASLRRARLVDADLCRASLQRADLYKCVLGNTSLHLSDLGLTVLDPELPERFPK